MRLIKRDGAWWIVNTPTPDVPEYGPYRTRAEADDDRQGVQRWVERQAVEQLRFPKLISGRG